MPAFENTDVEMIASLLQELSLRGPLEGGLWRAESDLCLALAWHGKIRRENKPLGRNRKYGLLETLSQLAMRDLSGKLFIGREHARAIDGCATCSFI